MVANLNNFCALPFGHTTVTTNGNFSVCCNHIVPIDHQVNINSADYNTWRASPYLNEVKQSFINNQRHAGCSACWQREDLNQESYRTRTSGEYKLLKVNEFTDTTVYLEIQLGNLCNLKCLMCNETDSSALLSENIQLTINRYTQKDFQWNTTGFKNLKQIINLKPRVINIRGGEPLYNKALLNIIEELPTSVCSQTVLHITTNATHWSPRWQAALKKFRVVRFMFSIDAVDDLYEYMRFPGNWNITQSNINEIVKMHNVKPLVYCIVQNLNIGSIGNVIAWSKQQNLHLQLELLSEPSWLVIDNLPHALQLAAIEHLTKTIEQDLTISVKNFLEACKTQLICAAEKTANINLWNTFKTQVGMRDRIRNNSHRTFLKY
jgi:molybdenum cofactor biosynthesis enzyme MoaA